MPAVDHQFVGDNEIAALKQMILHSGLSIRQLVTTAWAAAASYRGTDKRGGVNGARLCLAPQKDWEVNEPAAVAEVIVVLDRIRQELDDRQSRDTKVSLADLIVLGGMRVIDTDHGGASHGVLTDRPGMLTTDFFVTITDMGIEWSPSTSEEHVYEGRDRRRSRLRIALTAARYRGPGSNGANQRGSRSAWSAVISVRAADLDGWRSARLPMRLVGVLGGWGSRRRGYSGARSCRDFGSSRRSVVRSCSGTSR